MLRITLTSDQPGEGKTTLAAWLANHLVLTGFEVSHQTPTYQARGEKIFSHMMRGHVDAKLSDYLHVTRDDAGKPLQIEIMDIDNHGQPRNDYADVPDAIGLQTVRPAKSLDYNDQLCDLIGLTEQDRTCIRKILTSISGEVFTLAQAHALAAYFLAYARSKHASEKMEMLEVKPMLNLEPFIQEFGRLAKEETDKMIAKAKEEFKKDYELARSQSVINVQR